MEIILSDEQARLLRDWAARRTAAEVNANVEPSGYELVIRVCPPYACEAHARAGALELALGEVEVKTS